MSTWRRDRVGHYKLRRRLRSDPAGTVYKAKDARSGAPVTVMELAAELVADAHFLERFRHETDLLSRLNHPNCGRILDYLEIEGRVFVVSEPIEGRTLREVIGSAALRPPQALALLRASLVGLDAAHSVRVLHRNLRPESVVLERDGRVKVTGFGQPAYGAGAGAATPQAAGISPYTYLAPEQVVGAEADVRTDVYLAGVLGFELLAGQPPFTSLDPAEVLSMHMAQDPPKLIELRPEVTGSVADIVRQALAKAPDNRQQSAREFIGQIDAFGSPLGLVGTESTVVSRLGRVGPLAVGSPVAVENPNRGAVSGRGRLGWRPLRALVPGVAALALTLSAAADGYNPSWLGARGGPRGGQHSASSKPASPGRGFQLPGAAPEVLTPPGTELPTPGAALAAARVALPPVQVSPILLTAVELTPAQPPAAPPTSQPSPPGTPPPGPPPPTSAQPSPSPPPPSDEEPTNPPADAAIETPDTEDAAEAAEPAPHRE